jgi:very-short-patch-repair endonuclease
MRDLARRLELNYKAIASLDRTAFSTIIETNWSNAWQSELLSVIGTLANEIAETDAARAALQSALGLEGVAQDAAGLRALAVLADILPGGYGRDLAFAFVPNAATIIEHVETAAALVDNYVETERRLSVPYGPEACRRIQVADLRTRQAEAEASYWPMSILRGRSIRKDLSAQGGCSALPDTGADLPILADLVKDLAALDLLGAEASTIPTWDGTRTRTSMLRDLLDYAKELRLAAAALASSPDALITIRSALRKVTVDGNELLAEAMPIARAAASYATAHSRMALALERYAALSGTAIEDNADFIQSVRDICSTLKHEQQAIKSWCDWVRTRDEASHMDMQAIIAAVEADGIGIKGAIDAFETAYSRWWASARIDEESALRRFVSAEHADKIQLFRELDDKLSRLSARLVRTRICATIPARDDVAKSSAYGVLRHQMQLQRPRKAVRELVQEAGDALTTLTPCLLMSPLSIAQYLPPDGALFDLVIFDEASQITTWDAIGAIARGKQTIIAGDPKQMPPTSFFDRAAGHAADADADVEEDQESILDECLAASIPQHRLTWHYRSRHESLIAFSNHRYYGGELVTFPAPVTRDSAVQLVPVVGSYARGKGRTNQAEAQAMVHEVVRRLQDPAFVDATGKRLSLAVVTLNSEQQRLVEDLLDKERQANPALEPFFSDDLSEPVVVKNLETVQGDERDLILLGIGYGPETPGAPTMAMNFGPLNRMGGWRRLNVAITRAREELLVFASFPPHMVDLNRTSAEAVRDMKHYLEFAQKGPSALSAAVQGSVGDHESPFEEAVANRLRDKGWSIVPQIGVSRYRIDLGVVHPDRPGDYLLGIECDGASYHSAATARDRDKIRAAVLQSLGWRLARIWSTDWWIDPAGAAERLSAIIQKTLEDSRSASPAGTLTQTAADQSAAPEGECLTQSADNTEPAAALPASGVSDAPVFASVTPVLTTLKEVIYRYADMSALTIVPDPKAFFEPAYSAALREMIEYVVSIEGPILDMALTRRIAGAHGFQRSGGRIQARINDLIPADLPMHSEGDTTYYWPRGATPSSMFMFRRPHGERRRSVDEICAMELAALASEFDPLRFSEEQRIVAMAQAIGLQTLRAVTREKLQQVIRRGASFSIADPANGTTR